MSDIEEDAFQIARYMRDNNFTYGKTVLGGTVREALNLSPEDFDAADSFLRDRKFYTAFLAGDSAILDLTTSGVAFVSSKTAERINMSRDSERLARYLATKQTVNITFVLNAEIKADLQWNDEQYWEAGQILVDEGLAEVKPRSDIVPLNGLSLNAIGRIAVRNNFRRRTPAINLHTGDNISVDNSGANTAIAAGRGASVIQDLGGPSVDRLFEEIIHRTNEQNDLPDDKKQEIKDVVELAQSEVKQKDADEKRLKVYFQNLAMMAPDILDVAIAAASAPIAGPLPVVLVIAKKVSEKAKTDAQKKAG